MKRFFLFFCCFWTVLCKTYSVDLYYQIISEAKRTVCVRWKDYPDATTPTGGYGSNYLDEHITIPATTIIDGVTYTVTEIGANAFSQCKYLESVSIPNTVTVIDFEAFRSTPKLQYIEIPNSVTTIGDYAFLDAQSLQSIVIPDRVAYIGDFAFNSCNALRTVTIGAGVRTIGEKAFYACSKLENIICHAKIPPVLVNSHTFGSSGGTADIVLYVPADRIVDYEADTNWNPSQIKKIESIENIFHFEDPLVESICQNSVWDSDSDGILTKSEISSIKSLTLYGLDDIISGCPFAGTNISSFDELQYFTGITEIPKNAFSGCESLKSVVVPESVTNIGADAFSDCVSLTSISIPEGVTIIKSNPFLGCNNLTSMVVADSNPVYDSRNDCHAIIRTSDNTLISGCSVTNIPESVTGIGQNAFNGCTKLSSISIPKNVTHIGMQAFAYCPDLLNVYCYSKNAPAAEFDTFVGSNINQATLHVSESAMESYRTTEPWSGFGMFENLEIPIIVPDGEYYLYNADTGLFLSRGEYWGTCAIVDKYGIPFSWNTMQGALEFLDNEKCLFETDDNTIYTDNNSTGFAFEEVEGGYLLKSLKSTRYLTITDGEYKHQIVTPTDDASVAVVWQLKDKDEHDAIVAGYVNENYARVIEAADVDITTDSFIDYLSTLTAVDKTEAIGTARFAGDVGDWTYQAIRGWVSPSYGIDYCELSDPTGSYTQTLSGLEKGIYKVTMQGFEKTEESLYEKGYKITTATLSANGEEVNLKSWFSDISDNSYPATALEGVAKFNEGKYMNEIYTYVDADGELTITFCKPSHVLDNWVLFNNFTLTYYSNVVSVSDVALDQTNATLMEGETLALTATISPDNATDKTVTWSTSNAEVAVVDENGVVTAVAEGEAIITVTTTDGSDLSATCSIFVKSEVVEEKYDNTLSIEDVRVRAGEQVALSINMNNVNAITNFQFDLVLPEGITISQDEDGYEDIYLSTKRTTARKHTIENKVQSDGSMRVLCYSGSNAVFSGTEGEVLTITLNVSETLAEGDYTIQMNNLILTEYTNAQAIKHTAPSVESTISVFVYTPGDVNGDESIDVTDISGVVSFILNTASDGLIKKAADVNEDGSVDVTDISGVVNLILNVPIAETSFARSLTRASNTRGTSDIRLTVLPFTLEAGEEKEIYVLLDNPNDAFTGIQFDLYLPEGISVPTDADGYYYVDLGSRTTSRKHALPECNMQADGALRVCCFSGSNATFKNEEGDVLVITVVGDENLTGGVYDLDINHIVLSRPDVTNAKPADYKASILSGNGGEATALAFNGIYTSDVLAEFSAALANNSTITSIDLTEGIDVDATCMLTTGNPNTLVYLAEGASLANTCNVVSGDECSSLMLTDGYAFATETDFVASQASYIRELEIGKYGTIILPFAPNNENYIFYELVSVGSNTLTFEEVNNPQANTPYLYSLREGKSATAIIGANAIVSSEPVTAEADNWQTLGSFAHQTLSTNDEGYYAYTASDNQFHRVTKMLKVKPFRAYLKGNMVGDTALRVRIYNGNETLIDMFETEDKLPEMYYDLNGRCVEYPTKGIYVVNGKKIIL